MIVDDLKRAPLFAGLSGEQLDRVAGIASPVTLPAHTSVFSQGDRAHSFYLLAEGSVRVAKTLCMGRTATIRHVPAGDTFGESVLYHGTYPSGAETLAPSRLCRFETEAFRELMLAEPALALVIIATMAERLVMLNERVEELLLPVPARLARYLLELCEEQRTPSGCRLAVPRHELASRLGTVPETLSRAFHRFVEGRLIAAHGRDIEILNIDALERLSQQHWEAKVDGLPAAPARPPDGDALTS